MTKKKKTSRRAGTSVAAQLKALQKSWRGATPLHAGVPLPVGDYDVRIETAIVEEAKSSKRLQVNWGLIVISEELEGRKVHKYAGLDEQNLPYLQGDLETLELEIPESLEDIGEAIEPAVGLEVTVNVTKSDEFTNINFVELLEESEGEEAEEEEGDEESWAKGDRVLVDIDGTDYAGAITKLDEDEATVKFDDGDSRTYPLDDLREEEEEEEAEEAEEEPEASEEEEEEDELTVESITAMDRPELIQLIKKEKLTKINPKKIKKLSVLRTTVVDALFE